MSTSSISASRRLADHAGVPFVTLEPTAGEEDAYRPVDAAARALLPESLCRRLAILPFATEGDTVLIASSEPLQYLPYDLAVALAGRPVSFVVAPADQLARALEAPPAGAAR